MTNKSGDDDVEDKQFNLGRDLWEVEMKLEALAFLFRGHDGGMTMEEGVYIGISFFCDDLKNSVAKVKDEIDKNFRHLRKP